MAKNKVRNDDTTTSRINTISHKKQAKMKKKKFNKTERKWRSDDCGKVTSFLSENTLKIAKSNNNKCVANSYPLLYPISYIQHTYICYNVKRSEYWILVNLIHNLNEQMPSQFHMVQNETEEKLSKMKNNKKKENTKYMRNP